MRRILVILGSRIGDTVLQSGIIRHLSETYPAAEITLAVGTLPAPLFRAAPNVTRVIKWHRQRGGLHWLKLWRDTVGTPWSLVVDARGSLVSYCVLTRRRRVLGRPVRDSHKTQEAARLLKLTHVPEPAIWLDQGAIEDAHAALPGTRPILAVSPTAAATFKTWPAEKFAALIQKLTAPDGLLPKARVAVFAGPGDEAICKAAVAGVTAPVVQLAGKLDLLAVAAALSRASLFIGNDSGLMHVSAVAGAPTLGLFGPTDDRVYAPFGPRASVVRSGPQAHEKDRDRIKHADESLLTDLSVEAVLEAARARLSVS